MTRKGMAEGNCEKHEENHKINIYYFAFLVIN